MSTKIYIISPYSGNVEQNTKNAIKYCREAIFDGYIPIASHLYFPQMLDDNNPKERELGISLGLELLKECQEAWVYGKPSAGMKIEIDKCKELGIKVIYKENK